MDDARAVMDAVGSERAIVMGFSEGGPMATLFAATYPERDHRACPVRDQRMLETDDRLPVPCTHRRAARALRRGDRADLGYAGVRGARITGLGGRPRLRTMTTRLVGSRTTFVTPRAPELRSRSSG